MVQGSNRRDAIKPLGFGASLRAEPLSGRGSASDRINLYSAEAKMPSPQPMSAQTPPGPGMPGRSSVTAFWIRRASRSAQPDAKPMCMPVLYHNLTDTFSSQELALCPFAGHAKRVPGVFHEMDNWTAWAYSVCALAPTKALTSGAYFIDCTVVYFGIGQLAITVIGLCLRPFWPLNSMFPHFGLTLSRARA